MLKSKSANYHSFWGKIGVIPQNEKFRLKSWTAKTPKIIRSGS